MNLPLVIWLTLSAAGFVFLAVYQNKPGIQKPREIPVSNQQGLAIEYYIHPECECSKASLDELQKILLGLPAEIQASLDIYIFSAEGLDSESVQNRLHHSLAWEAHNDFEGQIARRSGVTTSGHASIAQDGKLLFSGGVTASRGVSGTNPYAEQFKSTLFKPESSRDLITTPVFGCTISP